MTTFAEKNITYSDGQINVVPLPEAVMANGFIPETRDAPGMPLAAQHLNWLFRDLYRQTNQLSQQSQLVEQQLDNVSGTADSSLQKSANLADIEDVEQALENLGLTNKLLPAWVPLPCPMEQAPKGYLKCNGSAFDKAKYPELAVGYPSGILPDLRGEFIRGWDDERGVDSGRLILSEQLDAFQGHWHTVYDDSVATGGPANNYLLNATSGNPINRANNLTDFTAKQLLSDGINGTPRAATETRPRNIAFLYIVRAA